MEIVDYSKDGFNIRIDSFYFSSFMFFFSFESSKSNCHFNGFFIIIQSQVTMHDECAAHPREEKKYVRKRIKTEEASLAGDVYAIPSIPTYPAFHDDQQDPCSAPIRNYIINRRRTAAQQQIISYR